MSWERATLKDLCLKVTKSDPASIGRERIRYIDIGGVDGTLHRLNEVPEIDAVGAPSRCRQIVAAGDTVFSTVRPYLEKVAYVGDVLDGEFASTGFSVLRPGPRLEPKFLHYFTISRDMFDQILPYQKGVSYPAVLDREVRSVSMPVPPLEEQRRIVAILEDHLSRLDAAEASLSSMIRRLVHYELAGVAKLFADAGQWPQRTAHQLVGEDRTKLIIGPFGSNLKTSDYRPEGVPLIFVRDIRANEFDTPRVFVDESKAAELSSHVVLPGDVLVTKMGEPPGDATVYAGVSPAIITADCIRLRPMPGIESRYVALAFGTPRVRSQIGKITSGVAQQKVSLGRFRNGVSIPIPPHDVQLRLIEQSQELFDAVRRLRTEINNARNRSAALRRSLLAAAFSGRLTGSSNAMSEAPEMIGA